MCQYGFFVSSVSQWLVVRSCCCYVICPESSLSHRRPAKAQASLCIRAVSPEPSLFTHMKCGSRWRVQPKIRHDTVTVSQIMLLLCGPRQVNLVLIAYASSEGLGEPAHARSLARTFAARSYNQWVKRNLQTESQIPGPSEWLGMHS